MATDDADVSVHDGLPASAQQLMLLQRQGGQGAQDGQGAQGTQGTQGGQGGAEGGAGRRPSSRTNGNGNGRASTHGGAGGAGAHFSPAGPVLAGSVPLPLRHARASDEGSATPRHVPATDWPSIILDYWTTKLLDY